MAVKDYYALLGVPKFHATKEQIRAAYLTQIKFFHPDARNTPPEISKEMTQRLNEAYDVLQDEFRKRIYDLQLRAYLSSQSQEEDKQQASSAPPPSPSSKGEVPSQSTDHASPAQEEHTCTTASKQATVVKPSSFRKFLSNPMLTLGFVCLVILGFSVSLMQKRSLSTLSNPMVLQDETTRVGRTSDILRQKAQAQREQNSASETPVPIENGQIVCPPNGEAVAPLSVSTKGNENFYILLTKPPVTVTEKSTGRTTTFQNIRDNISFYICAGESAEILVPLGKYLIYYATGNTWYGKKSLFGDDTSYYQCDGTFDFYADGDYYMGYTLELYPQIDGNLETSPIPATDFPV